MLSCEWREFFGSGPVKDWLYYARAVNQPRALS
jgi:hypothetical protein